MYHHATTGQLARTNYVPRATLCWNKKFPFSPFLPSSEKSCREGEIMNEFAAPFETEKAMATAPSSEISESEYPLGAQGVMLIGNNFFHERASL